MRGPPDPEMRSPGVTSARANRNSDKPGWLKDENYASRITFATAETALAGARNALLARGRLSDARKWFAHRGWKVLPKGIRGQRILRWGADQAWIAAPTDQKRKGSVRNWCRRWAPTLKDAELDQVVADTIESNKRWSADQSATVLGIAMRDRITHGFRFIGAMDDPNYEKRLAMKADKHAARSRRYRAAHSTGTKRGRPKSEGPKPWEVLGKSRRTYYRQRDAKSLILNDISGTKIPCRHLIDIGSVTEFKCHEAPVPPPLIPTTIAAKSASTPQRGADVRGRPSGPANKTLKSFKRCRPLIPTISHSSATQSPALAASGLACLTTDLDGDVFGAAPRERPCLLSSEQSKVPASAGMEENKKGDAKRIFLQRHAEASRRFRAARGAKPHAESLSRTRPWEALGISRDTFDRRRKKATDEGDRNAQ
jgi:hypothetical protein